MRYDARRGTLTVIVGDPANVPREILARRAVEAMRSRSFICHTTDDDDAPMGADEICFIPRSDHCEIVSIHTNGWRRHHGDHRRSLVEILNDLAAAVARGTLSFLDDAELDDDHGRGPRDLRLHGRRPDLARQARARPWRRCSKNQQVDDDARRRLELVRLRSDDQHARARRRRRHHAPAVVVGRRLRAIVADRGPGLNFMNWTEELRRRQPALHGLRLQDHS